MDTAIGGGFLQVRADGSITHPPVPQYFAIPSHWVRVEGEDITGFLSRQQYVAAIGSRGQNDGRSEVEIPASIIGTVGTLGKAGRVPHIIGNSLEAPHQLTAVHVQSDDSVRGVGGGMGKVFPGADIDAVAFGVDGRRGPDAGAGGPIDIDTVPVLPLQGCIRGGMPLPDSGATAGIQGDDAAVGFATDVAGAAGYRHLVGGHRHEQPVVMVADGTGDHRSFIDPGGFLPDHLQAQGIHCVDGRHGVGKDQ